MDEEDEIDAEDDWQAGRRMAQKAMKMLIGQLPVTVDYAVLRKVVSNDRTYRELAKELENNGQKVSHVYLWKKCTALQKKLGYLVNRRLG